MSLTNGNSSRAQKNSKPKRAQRQTTSAIPKQYNIQQTSYTSKEVPIPSEFLVDSAHDSQPITVHRIDFSQTPLPKYTGAYAVVLENVLSPSECTRLLALAEQSAVEGEDGKVWKQALVNVGGNNEMLADDYRKSERIIWDQQDLVNRIVKRCMDADGGSVGRDLENIEQSNQLLGPRGARYQRWKFTRGNERMRFLRYEKGMFFQRHCDGSYESPENTEEGKPYERTHYTLHLYLNGDGVEGGETTFWGPQFGAAQQSEQKRVDVKAMMGRVLIFQHQGLIHSGEEVQAGVKFTMRTDLLYKRVDDVDQGAGR